MIKGVLALTWRRSSVSHLRRSLSRGCSSIYTRRRIKVIDDRNRDIARINTKRHEVSTGCATTKRMDNSAALCRLERAESLPESALDKILEAWEIVQNLPRGS